LTSKSLYDRLVDAGPNDANPPNHESGLTIPAELQRYLSAETWRKLTAGEPRRGVLINALERLRSILYLLATYLPAHLVQEKMRRSIPGRVDGQLLRGTLLFSDVSGFTALAEKLAVLGPEGAERLTAMMNRYFETMLEILSWSGGILLNFAGDATLVYFPQQEKGEQAQWAVRAGHRMMAAMPAFSAIETPLGVVGLRMKIGIATGQFLGASVGTVKRMEYVVLGETVTKTMGAEGAAAADLVVIDANTAQYLEPALLTERSPGYFAAQQDPATNLGSFEIKADVRRPRGAVSWNASPHALVVQMEVALRQIESLTPYLAAELAERIVSGSRKRQIESEYRPTTVMFINFVGVELILTLGGPRGVRAATQLLNSYFNAMHSIIARYGGVVTRSDPYSKGSKMLVLFGAPVAHEDDPQRAVGAALMMQMQLTSLNRDWRQMLTSSLPADFAGPLIQQRIGITQGLTFAGETGSSTRREYTVMGDDVNLAARLMGAAQLNQILISKRVFDDVAGHFNTTALEPILVKGKSELIPIFQADSVRIDPLAPRLHSRGPLLGRQSELTLSQAVLRQSISGQSHLLIVAGSAGMGKSHLCDDLAAYALKQKARVLFSQCHAYTAGSPYAPWISLIQRLAEISPLDNADTGSQKLHQLLVASGLARVEYQRPLAHLLGLRLVVTQPPAANTGSTNQGPSPSTAATERKTTSSLFGQLQKKIAEPRKNSSNIWQLAETRQKSQSGQMWQRVQGQIDAREQERLFRAIYGLLWRLAVDGPLLIYLENSQWMDPVSQELLNYVTGQLDNSAVMVLIAQRDEEAKATRLNSDGRSHLHLAPLTLAGTSALLQHLLGNDSEDVCEAIHEQSSGNPLFIEELALWLQRSGPEGMARLKQGLRASTTIQELVLSRVDSLPPAHRDTAKLASIIGVEFGYDELRALIPRQFDTAVVQEHLSCLLDANLILMDEAGDNAHYVFRQTLIREVLYDNQPFAQRRELHALLAGFLEEKYAGNLPAQAELLAHHNEQAGRWLPAARCLILAALKARQRFAFPQALDYYERALRALAQLPAGVDQGEAATLRLEVQEGKGDIYLLGGDYAAAGQAYEVARQELIQANGPAPLLAPLLLKLALVLPPQGETAVAIEHARQAWQLKQAEHELAAAATLAWLLWRQQAEEATTWIDRAATLSHRSKGPGAAVVTALMADLGGDWQKAQQLYLDLERPAAAVLALCRLAEHHLQAEAKETAATYYRQAAELAEQEQDNRALALVRYRQAEVEARGGNLAAATANLQAALSLLPAAVTAVVEDRRLIEQALAGPASQMPDEPHAAPVAWRRHSYEDALHIALLFRPS
jgi:class 3 adenylate cyclase/tetratricopeptide (TPR) repeat protein